MKWNWAAVGATGTLIGGVAAVAAVFLSHPATAPPTTSSGATAFYLDGCEQRLRSINLRSARRSGQGQISLDFEAPAGWCECTGQVLESNFDADTVRGVGEWFHAGALGGAERSAEEEFFSQFSFADRTRVESAYDFARTSANGAVATIGIRRPRSGPLAVQSTPRQGRAVRADRVARLGGAVATERGAA